jgi:hypothetical protein
MVREPLSIHAASARLNAMYNFCNFAAYQLAWFAVVIGAANGLAWAGAAVALLVTAVHVAVTREVFDLKLIGVAAAVGLLIDSTLAMTGLVRFESAWSQNFAPFWMLTLWIAFATTLNHSLRWLMHRPVSAALGGALGGPMAYYAGVKLGALSIDTPTVAYLIISMLWCMALLSLSMLVLRASTPLPAARMPA